MKNLVYSWRTGCLLVLAISIFMISPLFAMVGMIPWWLCILLAVGSFVLIFLSAGKSK